MHHLLMISIVAYKIAVIVLVAGIVGASGTAVYYHDQQGTQISKSADLNTQIASLQNQINSLNSQVSQLNTQISQLQILDNTLGGNNGQLISQINSLNAQVNQLSIQITQLEAQISDLTAKLKLQSNRVIANGVCIYWDCPSGSGCTTGCNQVGAEEFISLGLIPYSGYLRVSWTGAHVSFTVQVLDINVTTPIGGSGIYSLPVSANATASAWFTGYDCQPAPGGTFCPPVTYSATYWY
jgi:cell division protein FtsB